jgi:sulfur carrier protein ThiS
MNVFYEKENKTLHIDLDNLEEKTGAGLLKHLDLNPQTVIFVKNDEVVVLLESLSDADEISLLSVVSGG